jgi:hypothetical protein
MSISAGQLGAYFPTTAFLYRSAISGESETGALTQRPHWRRGYIKSQPHGPRQSLRKIIWVSLRTGPGAAERRPIFGTHPMTKGAANFS